MYVYKRRILDEETLFCFSPFDPSTPVSSSDSATQHRQQLHVQWLGGLAHHGAAQKIKTYSRTPPGIEAQPSKWRKSAAQEVSTTQKSPVDDGRVEQDGRQHSISQHHSSEKTIAADKAMAMGPQSTAQTCSSPQTKAIHALFSTSDRAPLGNLGLCSGKREKETAH